MAQAGLVGGVGGAVGGAGSVGGTLGGTISGATGAAGGITGAPGNITGTASGAGNASATGNAGGLNAGLNANANASANVSAGVPQNLPQNDTTLRNAFLAMQQQQVTGRLERVARDQAQLLLANGTNRTLDVTGDMAAALSSSLGKSITLRTLDGTHANMLADSSEKVQGTVTALDKGYVSFVSASGLTYATSVDSATAPKGLHVGSHIVATSQNSWKTADIIAATNGNVAASAK
jgi:hypothetical protein